MRKNFLILFAWMLSWAGQIHGQSENSEFTIHPNGLIYSEKTMSQLGHIVDSLNLKFRTCDMNRVYMSKQQTLAYLIILTSGDFTSAEKDIKNNLPLAEFRKKYPQARVEENLLVVRWKYKNYKEQDEMIVETAYLGEHPQFEYTTQDQELYNRDLKDQWLYKHYSKTSYSKEEIRAFYFPESFTSVTLPQKYALMVGYADCMIDTTESVLNDRTAEGWVELPVGWESLPHKKQLELLEQMRKTRVVGFCSMDERPRQHAVNIALVSAQTAKWEVFLKAHLDIMNDRFERNSDGSYAWGRRNTYIRELEELQINVQDLLMGITFRIENPAEHHYFGDIGRLGRAISETQHRDEMETTLLSAISDTELDLFNRVILYFLFRNYVFHIADEKLKSTSQEKLDSAASTLPDYIRKRFSKD